ncbi:hypothetical protein lbkm_2659 [Lachnospiraceae bacterium KM106-2]|nr:hypothetical protein lbkm_2659 [Lachnospiraceae bacterium KM106-2]
MPPKNTAPNITAADIKPIISFARKGTLTPFTLYEIPIPNASILTEIEMTSMLNNTILAYLFLLLL